MRDNKRKLPKKPKKQENVQVTVDGEQFSLHLEYDGHYWWVSSEAFPNAISHQDKLGAIELAKDAINKYLET